jgi:ubiquinone/menaquinone biosynthesis C-methylase UbiE
MAGDSLEEYYRARAPEYEQIHYRDNPVRQSELAAEAKRLAELASGKSVLELACGTGYWTRVMSQTAASITASDIAPETLVEARKKEYGCEVTFVQADMFTHSFGVGSFDFVALGFWFSHHPRQRYDQLFDVLTRPLKKDGLIWMVDNNPPAEGSAEMSCHIDEFGNNYKHRYLSDGRPFVILKNYFSRNELEEILGGRFVIRSPVYNEYYWSALLGLLGTE